jgi:hypothetical protein
MPNGRSGGFVIETADLEQLVQAVSSNGAIGKLLTSDLHQRQELGLQPVQAEEIARLIEECPHRRFDVEEQDHAYYIVHISNEPNRVWVVISSQSPMFLELRDRHEQWMTDHPGWNGWMGF